MVQQEKAQIFDFFVKNDWSEKDISGHSWGINGDGDHFYGASTVIDKQVGLYGCNGIVIYDDDGVRFTYFDENGDENDRFSSSAFLDSKGFRVFDLERELF